jgi:hypothetical protein
MRPLDGLAPDRSGARGGIRRWPGLTIPNHHLGDKQAGAAETGSQDCDVAEQWPRVGDLVHLGASMAYTVATGALGSRGRWSLSFSLLGSNHLAAQGDPRIEKCLPSVLETFLRSESELDPAASLVSPDHVDAFFSVEGSPSPANPVAPHGSAVGLDHQVPRLQKHSLRC